MTEREQIIADARELVPNLGEQVDWASGPGKFEGNSDRELAVAIYFISLHGGADDQAGSVEFGLNGQRVGSYVLWEDDRGFVTLDHYLNEQAAQEALEAEDARQNPEPEDE